jgi:membrane protein
MKHARQLQSPLQGYRLKHNRYLAALAYIPVGIYSHGALGSAKGAAYSALLSFFPVFTFTTAALVQADATNVARRIATLLYEFSPPEVEQFLRAWLTEHSKHRASLRVAAVLLSLWAASGVMASLMEAFQRAYQKANTRDIVHQRLVAISLVVLSLLPAVGATVLLILGDNVEKSVMHSLGVVSPDDILRPGIRIIGRLIRYAVSLSAVCLVTLMLYHFGPDVKGPRRLLPGAALATFLWLVLTQAFTWYVSNVANYGQIYGSIGALIAFLVWMYMLALVAMGGCEFNAALDRSGRR